MGTTRDAQLSNGTSYVSAGQGECIIFIHGVGMGKEVWQPQIEFFSRHYRVVCYDMLGHGGSELPPEEAILEDYAVQLARLMDDLGIKKANIVGHSMGALVSLEFALNWPERVIRLVPMNAVYCRSAAQRQAVENRAKELADPGSPASLTATIARWFGDPVPAHLKHEEALVRHFLTTVNPVGYARTYQLFATSDRTHEGKFEKLTMPTLFLTGEFDPNSSPEMSQNMANASPSGVCHVIKNAKHMMGITSPSETNTALKDFLEKALN